MELEKRKNSKCSNIDPSCIKEKNMNSINIFDSNLKEKKDDNFKNIFKLKRNFK